MDAARLATVAGKPRLVAERDFTGIQLPGLRVEERIGAGGMGSVYRAVGDEGALFAVKFLSPAMAALPEVVERFRREIKLLATLDHPRIVKVRGEGEREGIPWFSMDLVEGPTLAARLEEGPLRLAEAQTLFPALFEALAHAHGHGVVHRDLKPANVLLSPSGPAIADFGIAHLDLDLSTRKTQLTQTHAILGTYPYMSPEQRAGRPVDHRSDLYSMGILVYEALAGTRPEGAFSPLHELRPEISGAMDVLVSRLLQPDREARLGSAAEAARLVATALAPRKRKRAGALLGGLLVVSTAAAWLLWGGGAPSRPGVAPGEVSKAGVTSPAQPKELPAPKRNAVPVEAQAQVSPPPPALPLEKAGLGGGTGAQNTTDGEDMKKAPSVSKRKSGGRMKTKDPAFERFKKSKRRPKSSPKAPKKAAKPFPSKQDNFFIGK